VAQASPHFALCDETCQDVDPAPVSLGYPVTTTDGTPTVEAVQSHLAAAWAGHSGTVDLWLRTGCHGAREAKHLFESVELFWPRGIGRVVVVLDANDRQYATHILPATTKHDYAVHFEHVPCMAPRIFNQVSYLMADHYSSADVIVTIDSDCVLHSPVTPRLLFRDGKVRLPHSNAFQPGMWTAMVDHFLGPGSFKFHFMTSQPVAFHRSSFAAFRAWHEQAHGRCYLDAVAKALDAYSQDQMFTFCWMCQLGSFVNNTGITSDLYDFVDLDSPTPHPYQRLAIHVPYELAAGADYDASARAIVKQGLCWTMGASFADCRDGPLDYLHDHQFKYHTYEWVATAASKEQAMQTYLAELWGEER
jgi:hypothetical protein